MLSRRKLILSMTSLSSLAILPPEIAWACSASGVRDKASFIQSMPKVELHLHIEGTLEPEMKFRLAERNGIKLPYASVIEMRDSYIFNDLKSFLKVYYEGMEVLRTEQDFYELGYAYFKKASFQNVIHAEIFFDPQAHTSRGVRFADIVSGLTQARLDALRDFGIESSLVASILRDHSSDSAEAAFLEIYKYRNYIVGLGLDSDERDNPPSKFANVFRKARQSGFKLAMHCDIDQKNTLAHIREAIEVVGVDRVDHGGNILESHELMDMARKRGTTFNICPVSSGWINNHGDSRGERKNIIRGMIDNELSISINSDDPAYMGGNYISESFSIASKDSALTKHEMLSITRNAIDGAWIDDASQSRLRSKLAEFSIANCS
jgi:adenosine deaminase